LFGINYIAGTVINGYLVIWIKLQVFHNPGIVNPIAIGA